MSLDSAPAYSDLVGGVTTDRFFSRITEVDYSLVPNAPADLIANTKTFAITIKDDETVTLTFDGAGGGTWSHSSSGSGNISAVEWLDSAPSSGVFPSPAPQAKYIPLGKLKVTFDSPMGSERWDSFDFDISFHTAISGRCVGQAKATVYPPVLGSDPIILSKNSSFIYTP